MDVITQIQHIVSEMKDREAAWPPIFLTTSYVPNDQLVVLHYSMFMDGRWRVLFDPSHKEIASAVMDIPGAVIRRAVDDISQYRPLVPTRATKIKF